MYLRRPDPNELADGVTWDDVKADYDAEIWPDNTQYVDAFCALKTQWRVGARGATGLDYTTIPQVLRLLAVPRKEWSDTFAMLRVMEAAALDAMHER